jgi:hypothetical protein
VSSVCITFGFKERGDDPPSTGPGAPAPAIGKGLRGFGWLMAFGDAADAEELRGGCTNKQRSI